MIDAPSVVPIRSQVAHRATRSLLVALLALVAPIGCVTTRVVERPADGAIDVPVPPPYRTVGDDGTGRDAPDVRIWTSTDQTYQRGDRVRALFRVREDAYVTIVRLDTDGRMRVLYPRTPNDDNWVQAGHTYRVPGYTDASFVVDDPTGVGYVFAISSYKPFDFGRYAVGHGWDQVALASRVHGDPFVALRSFAERIAYDANTGYATDYAEYYVDRRVDYPRYAYPDCNDSRVIFDPYDAPCTRYFVIVYDDGYYPYRYYPGTRVVYVPRPRYEWRPPTPSTPGNGHHHVYVEHRNRTPDVDPRRPGWPNGNPGPVAGGNPGSSRPGNSVPPGTGPGRRPDDTGRPATPPHYGAGGPPRRDSSRVTPPTVPGSNGNGGVGNGGVGNGGVGNGGVGNGGNGDDDRANHGRGPRRDPATTRDDGHDRGRGRGDDAGRDDRRRTGDDSAPTTRAVPPGADRAPQPHEREMPRADVPRTDVPRSDVPRTDVPRSDVPRADAPPSDLPGRRDNDARAADERAHGGASDSDRTRSDAPRTYRPAPQRPADDDQPRADQPRADQPRGDRPNGDQPRADEPRRAEPREDARPSDAPSRAEEHARQAPDRNSDSPRTEVRKDDGPKPEVRKADSPKPEVRKGDGAKDDSRKSGDAKDDDHPPKPFELRRRLP